MPEATPRSALFRLAAAVAIAEFTKHDTRPAYMNRDFAAMGRAAWGNKTLRERFDEKWVPEPNTGCWLWLANVNNHGYGKIGKAYAHRAAWELYRGAIPKGMVIDHICRTRCCVNPDHLRVVTQVVNVFENSNTITAAFARKTHCNKGHPLTGDNLYHRRDQPNTRACRTCRDTRAKARDRRHDTRQADRIAPFLYEPSTCLVCGQPTMPQSVYCSEYHRKIVEG